VAYIPADATWYVAEIVERIRVGGAPRCIAHVGVCLIRADSPEEALARARAQGQNGELRYLNPQGEEVTVEFLGLRDLNVVHEPLGDGAELFFEEHRDLDDAQALALVRAETELAVFRPIAPPSVPDYSDAEVLRDADLLVKGSSP
jgi:Domain of unknown function (DUF4288)